MSGFDFPLVIATLTAAVRAGTPYLFTTLGEIFSERSGVLNLGLEGLMLIGALSGFVTATTFDSPWLGVLVAVFAGGLASLLLAFLCVTMRTNQVVTGLALTLLGTGISAFLGQFYLGMRGPNFEQFQIPLLADIPALGPILFQHDVLVYISYLLVPLSWYFIFHTRPGLELRSVGESPKTADSEGLNVFKIRYIYVVLGGMFAGLGGAYLSVAYNSLWVENMTGGRGWICLALVIFAAWNPLYAMLGSYLFGGMNALRLRLESLGFFIPSQIMMMLPYLITILVLAFYSSEKMRKKLGAPTAVGTNYSREQN